MKKSLKMEKNGKKEKLSDQNVIVGRATWRTIAGLLGTL